MSTQIESDFRSVEVVLKRRPRLQRFGDLQLDMLWAAIEVVDDARQHEFLRELATHLAVDEVCNAKDGVRAALAALRDAAEILGHAPTLYAYRRLHAQLPELKLVPDGTLRSWLGGRSWNNCLSLALLEAVSDGDFSQPSKGDAFSEEELVAAVREHAEEHDGKPPTLQELLAWARDPEVQARPGRRPLSWNPFQRFGGYRAVLTRNRLLPEGASFVDRRGRVIPMENKYSEEELRAAVRQVVDRLGRLPHESEYRDERLKILSEARRAGSLATLPTTATLIRRFGRWSRVLEQGCPEASIGKADLPAGRRPRYTTDQKLDWLKEAWVEIGQPFSQERFSAWRQQRLVEAASRGEFLEIPSLTAIYSLPGGWVGACTQALPSEAKLWRRRR